MAHYETDTEVYEQLGGILRNLLGNADRLGRLREVDAVVQYAFEAPRATITFDVRARSRPQLDLGETKLRPDVVLGMEADVGRALLLGELNPTLALARGAVQVKGPVGKVLRLIPATAGAAEVEVDAPLAEPEAEAVVEATPAEPEAEAVVEATPAETEAVEEVEAPAEAEAAAEPSEA